MEKCAICHKRIAVVFMTKMEPDGSSSTQGICLKCAKDLGLKPVDDIIKNLGISPDEIDFDSLEENIEQFADSFSDSGADTEAVVSADDNDNSSKDEASEGRAPSIDFNKIFGGKPFPMGGFIAKMQEKGSADNQKRSKSEKDTAPKYKYLTQFCTNLNDKAKKGALDRIVGRERELERVMQILCRRQKNNPCLIGEPGEGKTAGAEALAQKIVDKNVPIKLIEKEIYLVDLTALVAGTQFRGQFEARMQGLLSDVRKKGNAILAIDEVHNLVGAGEAEGSMNAANILKPALSRGEIQVIGATTLTEYRKHIEKDTALERRFQPVIIDEPSVAETIEIIKGIKHYYENYHGVGISEEIAERAVVLSERYITDRYLPDKAIDLIDEAAAHVVLKSDIINKCEEIVVKLTGINRQIEALEADLASKENVPTEDYEKLASMKSESMKLQADYDLIKPERDAVCLTLDDIADVIEIWTGIPASSINESEFKRLDELESRLKKRIVGQDKAVEAVVRAIKRNRAGVSYKKKPVSFIFAGPTGVGKTQLVKTLAEDLFNSPEALIRLDMSEFMEKHAVSRIIGAPPGYVGYDDAGQLTEKIRRKPYSVVLFDEIEKAHPEIMNILLQILDDGRITDAHGKIINFENTILIMTTNAGSDLNSSTAGFGLTDQSVNETKTEKALNKFLRPEFINRIDEIVTFNSLGKNEFASIALIMLDELKQALSEKGIKITWSNAAIDFIAEKSFSAKYGARNMRRYIQTEVEDYIAEQIIKNYNTKISAVSIDTKDDKLKFMYV